MRSNFFSVFKRLVLPFGAPADAPSIRLGDDIPAELQAEYGGWIVAAQIFRITADHYIYKAVIDSPIYGEYYVQGQVVTGADQPASGPIAEMVRHTVRFAFGEQRHITYYGGGLTGATVRHIFGLGDIVDFEADAEFSNAVDFHGQPRFRNTKRDDYFTAVSAPANQALGPAGFTTADRSGAGMPAAEMPSAVPITITADGWYLITIRSTYTSGPTNGVRATALTVNGAFAEELKVTGVPVAQDQTLTFSFHKYLTIGADLGVNTFMGSGFGGVNNGVKNLALTAKLETT